MTDTVTLPAAGYHMHFIYVLWGLGLLGIFQINMTLRSRSAELKLDFDFYHSIHRPRQKFPRCLWCILEPIGQMPFTSYFLQLTAGFLIFYDFDCLLQLASYKVCLLMAGIWISQLIFSNAWMFYFNFGPFEWLWHSITSLKKTTMIRSEVCLKEALRKIKLKL